ncbi:MAG: alcohol dehydrogenase catalytic domain-containing protein [Ilumatobacteraceae bacterium]
MPTSARAVITGEGGVLDVVDVTVDDPADDEVLVDLHASGVCHTDHDLRSYPGTILGHEGAGTVSSVGSRVSSVEVGDRVLLNWAMPCGACFQCVDGNEHLCEVGSPLYDRPGSRAHRGSTTRDGRPVRRAFGLGTMSTATLVPDRAVTRMPEHVSFAAGAIAGCGVMTGVGSVFNAARVEPGASVVVLGCGGVGLNVVQGARIAGALPIIAIDVNAGRLELAIRFGATEAMLADRDDRGLEEAARSVRERCGGRGADYAFECTAVPELGAAPLAMIRHGGTAIQVSGIEQTIEIDMRLFEFDKTYINPLYGQCRPSRDFPRLFALHAKGALLLDELVTRCYRIDDVAEAFDDMLAGRNAKGVIELR